MRNHGRRVVRLLGREQWLYERPEALAGPAAESLRNVWVAMERARWRYRPRGCLGAEVVLFRSGVPLDAWSLIAEPDPRLGWSRYTDAPVEVRSVAGDHLEMFHDDNVKWLARQVCAAIDRVANGHGPAHHPVATGAGPATATWQPSAG